MSVRPLGMALVAGALFLCLVSGVAGLAWVQASLPARWLFSVNAPDGCQVRFGSRPSPDLWNFPHTQSEETLVQIRQGSKTRTYRVQKGGDAINTDVSIYRQSTTGELLFLERDRLIAHYVPSQRWFMDVNYVQQVPLEGEDGPRSRAPHQDLSGFPYALTKRGKEWKLLGSSAGP